MLRRWKGSRRPGMCGRKGFLGIGNRHMDDLDRDRIVRYMEYVWSNEKCLYHDLSLTCDFTVKIFYL